jgi:chromate transporter
VSAPKHPSFAEALRFWFKLGLISFGGPAGQIGIMHEYLVEKRRWISDQKFLHALNYCMLLPGPEAQQLATYTGWLLHGTRGGLAAGLLFVLPSMLLLGLLSTFYVLYGTLPAVDALFYGLKPAVVAIVLLALYRVARRSLNTLLHLLLALASFAALFVFQLPFPLLMVSILLFALLLHRFRPSWLTLAPASGPNDHAGRKVPAPSATAALNEEAYLLHSGLALPHTRFRTGKLLRTLGVCVALWFLPLGMFAAFSDNFSFWKTLSLFFSQAALVTFGGAYAVLPYVAQVSVEQLGWLSSAEMVDGLALGETTPGPLVMVLAFVGYMAGYNHFDQSIGMGLLGLTTTTFYTFLPCFLFIFAGAPLIEKTQANRTLSAALSLVTAGVVGVILNLTLYLAREVLFQGSFHFAGLDEVAAGWMLVSLVALARFKVNMIRWIGISALFGLVLHGLRTLG